MVVVKGYTLGLRECDSSIRPASQSTPPRLDLTMFVANHGCRPQLSQSPHSSKIPPPRAHVVEEMLGPTNPHLPTGTFALHAGHCYVRDRLEINPDGVQSVLIRYHFKDRKSDPKRGRSRRKVEHVAEDGIRPK